MQVEVPIFQDLPRLPAPFGALYYTQVRLAVPLASFAINKNLQEYHNLHVFIPSNNINFFFHFCSSVVSLWWIFLRHFLLWLQVHFISLTFFFFPLGAIFLWKMDCCKVCLLLSIAMLKHSTNLVLNNLMLCCSTELGTDYCDSSKVIPEEALIGSLQNAGMPSCLCLCNFAFIHLDV